MDLVPCARCRRHVIATSERCPFCEAPSSGALARFVDLGGRVSRAAVFAGAAACTQHPAPAQQIYTPPPPPPADAAVEAHEFAQPPDDAATQTANGAIDGTLVDGSSNRPIPGAAVRLQTPAGGQSQTQTDEDGRFRFDGLLPGNYVVWTEYQGGNPRIPPPRQGVNVTANQSAKVRLVTTPYVPDRGPCCKPYGAPPARRRVV